MNTVLVTGGAGYIGSHTCKALARNGFVPIVYDNLSEGHREFVKWGELIEGDTRDTDRLGKVLSEHKPQAVIHFAASAYVGDSINQPQRYYENNVLGSLSLLQAMNLAGVRNLVFSSTCAVYGEALSLPIKVGHPTNPINPYGRTKLMVEQMLADCAAADGLNSVSLRYFNAAGADSDLEIGERHNPEPHLVPNAIRAALDQSTVLEIYGDDYDTQDGTCVRDYVHVDDLADGHLQALSYLQQNPGCHTFNLGAGTGTSINQVIEIVEDQTGSRLQKVIKDRRSGDPASLYADVSDSSARLGWQPGKSDMRIIIETAIAWARKDTDSLID